jgi:hypothetical protein
MHSTGSFLLTVIERLRAYLDEAIMDAKYTNDYLVRHVICPEMVNVMSRLSNNADNLIRIRHEITLVKDQEHYILPPNIGEIYRFAVVDSNGRITKEFMPRNEFNPTGPGWHIQGNLLSIRPFPGVGETADIHYIPTGDFFPHYHAGSESTDGGEMTSFTTFVFDDTPTLGGIDNRENAYAGAVLRVWTTAAGHHGGLPDHAVLEERIIESYDASTRIATVRRPFTTDICDGTKPGLRYEVAPVGMNSLYQAITCAAAMNLGTARNITQKQMTFLIVQYKMAMKTIGDNLSFMQARKPKHFEKNTVDNRSSYLLGD